MQMIQKKSTIWWLYIKKLDHNKAHQNEVEKYAHNTAKINAGKLIPNLALNNTNSRDYINSKNQHLQNRLLFLE